MFLNTHKLLKKPQFLHGILRISTQMQTIKINNQVINYLKVGTGPRNVLCFPGAMGTIWTDFKPQIEGLDKSKFTVIAWDPPGYGQSRPPQRKFDIDFYESDTEYAYQLLKNIGIQQFSLLGWSDGGISSMILAGKYPENVEKLVIWGANSYVTPEELPAYEKITNISNWSEKMKASMTNVYTEKELQDLFLNWYNTIFKIVEKKNGDICKDILSKIVCPTFILHGDKDPLVAPEHPTYLFSNIKHAKLHHFSEGKHNIHLRYANEFNQLVTEFLIM